MNTELLRPAEDRRTRMVIGGFSGFCAAAIATVYVGDALLALLGVTLVLTLVFSLALTAAYRFVR